VARADTSNAHVRKGKRGDPAVKAADASRFLNDPAFVEAFEGVRSQLIEHIENLVMDGTPETAELENELCRTLRSLKGVKRALILTGQKQKLRLADFQAGNTDPEEQVDG